MGRAPIITIGDSTCHPDGDTIGTMGIGIHSGWDGITTGTRGIGITTRLVGNTTITASGKTISAWKRDGDAPTPRVDGHLFLSDFM
jgi:hypothetical protein